MNRNITVYYTVLGTVDSSLIKWKSVLMDALIFSHSEGEVWVVNKIKVEEYE